MAQPQPTPPGSSASSTSSCEGNYYGQFTLIQFIQEIENEARSNVHSLLTGNRALVIYHSSSPNPQTINLLVDAAVAYCEQEEAADAINRTNVNRQHERRRVSPKKPSEAHRILFILMLCLLMVAAIMYRGALEVAVDDFLKNLRIIYCVTVVYF